MIGELGNQLCGSPAIFIRRNRADQLARIGAEQVIGCPREYIVLVAIRNLRVCGCLFKRHLNALVGGHDALVAVSAVAFVYGLVGPIRGTPCLDATAACIAVLECVLVELHSGVLYRALFQPLPAFVKHLVAMERLAACRVKIENVPALIGDGEPHGDGRCRLRLLFVQPEHRRHVAPVVPVIYDVIKLRDFQRAIARECLPLSRRDKPALRAIGHRGFSALNAQEMPCPAV